MESHCCRQIQDGNKEGRKPRGRKCKSVRWLLIFFFIWEEEDGLVGRGVILWFMSPCTTDSLLPAPALKPQTPFASRGLGRLCPTMRTETVRGMCIICLSALGLSCSHNGPARNRCGPETWLSWLTNSSSALPISRGNFRYKDVALTVESNQRSYPPTFPHLVYIYGHPFVVLNIFP